MRLRRADEIHEFLLRGGSELPVFYHIAQRSTDIKKDCVDGFVHHDTLLNLYVLQKADLNSLNLLFE